MKKLFPFLLALLVFGACEKQRFEDKNPTWLDQLIEEMEVKPYYGGSYINQYTWQNHFYYEITIPVSSCMYCDVYDYEGNRINWEENEIDDYLENRSKKLLIWKHPNTWP